MLLNFKLFHLWLLHFTNESLISTKKILIKISGLTKHCKADLGLRKANKRCYLSSCKMLKNYGQRRR
jgi:hypothetical protein